MHKHPYAMWSAFRQLLHNLGVINGRKEVPPGIFMEVFNLLLVLLAIRKHYRPSNGLSRVLLWVILWLMWLGVL
jgi:hypothetical protein